MSQLALYEHAREALAAAVRIDEVVDIRNDAERAKAYAKIAKDRKLQADATELVARAERKLGILLRKVKEAGLLSQGGRPAERSNLAEPETGADAEPVFDNSQFGSGPGQTLSFTLAEIGVDKKLSSRAQKVAALGDDDFEHVVEQARNRIISGSAAVINPAKDVSTAGKKTARAAREAELGRKQVALPEARFGVIYADPEWRFGTWSENGMDRSADNHYPTSSLEAIKNRDVGSLAADDSICWLWVTVPMLLEGIEVLAAWGFEYKSHLIWKKDRIGTGYWFRNKHELLLIGTRGRIPAPAMGEQFPSVIEAPVGAHSAKPDEFYEIIEAYFPTLPKIELNARQAREGWVRWGYEAPEENTPKGSGTAREASGGQPLPDANGEGDIGDLKQGTQSAPQLLPTHQADAVIRSGYSRGAGVAELAEAIGRPGKAGKAYVRNRARVMGISSRDNQRAAASAFATAQHAARKAEGGEA